MRIIRNCIKDKNREFKYLIQNQYNIITYIIIDDRPASQYSNTVENY